MSASLGLVVNVGVGSPEVNAEAQRIAETQRGTLTADDADGRGWEPPKRQNLCH
jgi:hypothetical protein